MCFTVVIYSVIYLLQNFILLIIISVFLTLCILFFHLVDLIDSVFLSSLGMFPVST